MKKRKSSINPDIQNSKVPSSGCWSDKGFKDTIVSRALASLHGGLLEITLNQFQGILVLLLNIDILTKKVSTLKENIFATSNDCLFK